VTRRDWPSPRGAYVVDSRPRAGDRTARDRTADAESRDFAACRVRGDAGAAGADRQQYSISEILDACRRFPLKHRDRITFEYVMLAGMNDSDAEARKLAKLLRGLKAKVNLIPLNPAAGIPFERPSDDRINDFARILAERHVTVSVRKSRGQDIRAACGSWPSRAPAGRRRRNWLTPSGSVGATPASVV